MREASVDKVAILVGVIKPVLLRVQQYFESGPVIRSIPVARNGYELLKPPAHAKQLLEHHAEEASSYENVVVVVAPYCRVHKDVRNSVDTLADVGARIIRMKQGAGGCPILRGRMDAEFQEALVTTIVGQLAAFFFDPAEESTVAFELLRGLVSHDKMGRNNHSHEDDLWKHRGDGLQPSQRRRIVRRLMDKGILGRKKNKSLGGTGWVYWIDNPGLAFAEFPRLAEFAGEGSRR